MFPSLLLKIAHTLQLPFPTLANAAYRSLMHAASQLVYSFEVGQCQACWYRKRWCEDYRGTVKERKSGDTDRLFKAGFGENATPTKGT